MSKRKKNMARDHPAESVRSGTVALTTADLWERILCDGYRPLYECPEVRMCVDAYADMISNMTIHLMRNTERGDERIRNGLSALLDISPCTGMNRKSWVWYIVNVMLTSGDGNCVVFPEITSDGYIKNLRPCPPNTVSFVEDGEGYHIVCGDRLYSPEEVLHFSMRPSPSKPWLGTGMRVSLREVVQSLRQAGATKNALLESPVPSLIVAVDGLSDEMDSVAGRDRVAEKYISQSKSGKPWIISSEIMKIEQVKPLTLADLAIRDNIELDRRTVAGIFGMPPHMVGIGAYDEKAQRNFIGTKLIGIAQYIQQELTSKLLIASDLYVKFNPRSLYNYDLSELTALGGEMVDRMAMRRNEWRDWIGLSPDPDMDDLLALENYIPADRLGDQKKLTGEEG